MPCAGRINRSQGLPTGLTNPPGSPEGWLHLFPIPQGKKKKGPTNFISDGAIPGECSQLTELSLWG